MTIKMGTIAQLQKAGQAVHDAFMSLEREAQTANVKLQKALQEAMQAKSDNAQTEMIFTQWKSLVKVSQEVAQMEAALREVYVACTALASSKQIESKVSSGKKGKVTPSKAAGTETLATKNLEKMVDRPPKGAVPGVPREGNEHKLMEYFWQILNTTEMKQVHHLDITKATGIPPGSVAATIKRLAGKNLLETGRRGALRLIVRPAPPAAEAPAVSA